MDYKAMYSEKLTTAEEAVKVVKNGDWVDYGWCVGTPDVLDQAMAKRLPEMEDVNFRGGVLMRVPAIYKIDDPAAHMTWNFWPAGVPSARGLRCGGQDHRGGQYKHAAHARRYGGLHPCFRSRQDR